MKKVYLKLIQIRNKWTQLITWPHRKKLIQESESLKAERNNNSALVPKYKKEGKDVAELIAKTKEIGAKIGEVDSKLGEVEEKINDFLCRLPNMPDEDLLAGEKENNKVIYTFGNKPEFSLNHFLTLKFVKRKV